MSENAALKIIMALTTVAISAAAAAPPGNANPAVGSVIQSWLISSSQTQCLTVARDANYVYGFYSFPTDHIRKFTPSGSLIGSYDLDGALYVYGACKSHLGSNYVLLADTIEVMCYQVNLATGSVVSSFPASAAGGGALKDCAYNGTYYFSKGGNDGITFARYTTAGASAGTWTATGSSSITWCGGIDWTQYLNTATNGGSGYMVVYSQNPTSAANVVTYPGGSLVAWWDHAGTNGNTTGCFVGPPSNAAYGETCWANIRVGNNQYWCYEVDLGNGASALTPASVGRIKAIYR